MTLVVANITRVFSYNGIRLSDPAPDKTPDKVRSIYAFQYPELNNAVVEGPVTKNGTSTYTFQRAVGSKGVGHLSALTDIQRGKTPTEGEVFVGASQAQIKENKKCSMTVHSVVNARGQSTPILPGPMSFSHYG